METVSWISNEEIYVIGVGLVAFGFLISLPWYKTDNWEWLDCIPKRRGKMLRKNRREYVKQQAVEDFVNCVEEKVFSGHYTREEAKELYREFKKCFPIRDVFPSPRLLKEAIQKRRSAHVHEPVPLPDVMAPVKRKHLFDKSVA